MISCQTCKWFDRANTDTGLCRLIPPTVIPAQMKDKRTGEDRTKPFTAWPLVRNLDWCGDHEHDG